MKRIELGKCDTFDVVTIEGLMEINPHRKEVIRDALLSEVKKGHFTPVYRPFPVCGVEFDWTTKLSLFHQERPENIRVGFRRVMHLALAA